jgi:hypothetical protein
MTKLEVTVDDEQMAEEVISNQVFKLARQDEESGRR